MLSINTNLSSLIVQGNLQKSTDKLNLAIERMTTGYKINHASDNAANFSISTNMDTKIGAYMVAEENAMMGLDMLMTAEASLNLISDKLSRLRSLAVAAQNGTYGDLSLDAISAEANALIDEIERVYNASEYSNSKIFLKSDTTNTTYSIAHLKDMISLTKAIDDSILVSGEEYKISSAEELAKLATLVNNGTDTTGMTFVLANDIDLETWCLEHSETGGWVPIGDYLNEFRGTFDGNGHVIKDLLIDRDADYQGLFGQTSDTAIIKDLGIEDCSVTANSRVGSLVGLNYGGSLIKNCYATGNVRGKAMRVGGLVGMNSTNSMITSCYANVYVATDAGQAGGLVGMNTINSVIETCYSSGDVSSTGDCIGALVGNNYNSGFIQNCYALGRVLMGNDQLGGLIGLNTGSSVVENSYAQGDVLVEGSSVGGFIGMNTSDSSVLNCAKVSGVSTGVDSNTGDIMTLEEIQMKYTSEYMKFTEINGWLQVCEHNILSWQKEAQISEDIQIQVGICGLESSQINCNLGFSIYGIDNLRKIGSVSADYLTEIDKYISMIADKEVEYGSIQNRLMSVLEEISVQYDNLVSSRSTIKDADMAEISSQYIQQQILQEASATLLATANQTPALALQLL